MKSKICKSLSIYLLPIVFVVFSFALVSCEDKYIDGEFEEVCILKMETENGIFVGNWRLPNYHLELFFPSWGGQYEIFNGKKGSKNKPWSIERIECDGKGWNRGDDMAILKSMGISELKQKSVYQYILEMNPNTTDKVKEYNITLKFANGRLWQIIWPQFPAGGEVDRYFSGDRDALKDYDDEYSQWRNEYLHSNKTSKSE